MTSPPESIAAPDALQAFLAQLGSAMARSGQPADIVQSRLVQAATAYGSTSLRVSAFPTYLMVTMGAGEPATLEVVAQPDRGPRLDEIALIDELAAEAVAGQVTPTDGLARLAAIADEPRRFGPATTLLGSSLLSVGLSLVLGAPRADVGAAAVFGLLVGVVRAAGRRWSELQVLLPVLAAFGVSALCALAIRLDVAEPGMGAIVAALVVFLPGATLTTGILELGAGDVVSGASRVVAGVMALALLAFGIVAGVQAVGVPLGLVLATSGTPLGAWAPWLGLLAYTAGVTIAYSAPRGSALGLVVVLVVAYGGQALGNEALGGLTSTMLGATLMTVAAFAVARTPGGMPPHAAFLPGFWLLVPGSLGLVGVTKYVSGTGSSGDVVATLGSIFSVAIGVLVGTLVWRGARATGRVVDRRAER